MPTSDVSQEYQIVLSAHTAEELRQAHFQLVERARRDMYAEGAELSECAISATLLRERGAAEALFEVSDPMRLACELASTDSVTLHLRVVKPVRKARIHTAANVERHDANACGSRKILGDDGERVIVPVFRVEELAPGATACGPALIGEAYLSGKVKVFFELNGQPRSARIAKAGLGGTIRTRHKADEGSANRVGAPMPGSVVTVAVKPGQKVRQGEPLLSLEAIKMEAILTADRDATIKAVHVRPGDAVAAKDLLIELV